MSHLPRLVVARCAVAAVTLAALASPAAAQANCDMYGKLAVQQQQENEDGGCGFSGDEWSSDLKRHVDWCGSVPPDEWKVELQERQQALDTCKAKETE